MTNHNPLPYFSPLLPWQTKAWEQVTHQFYRDKLPHALFAQGMAGIGKRAFSYRLAAWLLCQHKPDDGACGDCPSCLWLKAGTHPDLHLLPKEEVAIKIDDIRELSDIVATKGNLRVLVFDGCENMTLAAANALLKTLEEPSDGVFMLLISDHPMRVLPTIKSRLQTLPLGQIEEELARQYVSEQLQSQSKTLSIPTDELLVLADFAPLGALTMATSAWFDYRQLWLKTFLALRKGRRTVVQASDYWQSVLTLGEFLQLSQVMLVLLYRFGLGLPTLHSDVQTLELKDIILTHSTLDKLQAVIDDTQIALTQNVQDKLAFDNIFVVMAQAD